MIDILAAAQSALTADLPVDRVEVLIGDVPMTPTLPYILLSLQPPLPRRCLSGHSHRDRSVLMAMAVNNSHEGALALSELARVTLDELSLDGPRLRYDYASPAIKADPPGTYRWSVTADYVIHYPRSPHA